jgi:ankyrin repeat protein
MRNEDLMYRAITRNEIALVRELIDRNPALLTTVVVGCSWLHWAARGDRIEIIEILLRAGLIVDQLSVDGSSTPLNAAAGLGKYAACKTLLDHGAEINRGIGSKATPIFSAIFSRSLPIVELFLDHGADLSATFSEPMIDVIRYAEQYGTPEIVSYLRLRMNG